LVFDFSNDGEESKGVMWAAFFADAYHSVNNLESGYRACLVYSLTAAPRKQCQYFLPATIPQPCRENKGLHARLVNGIRRWSLETDASYPDHVNCDNVYYYGDDPISKGWIKIDIVKQVKPVKLVAVLSHSYTQKGLKEGGIDALKGRDRTVAELLAGAQRLSVELEEKKSSVPSLLLLAAHQMVEADPTEYQVLPSNAVVHDIIKKALATEAPPPSATTRCPPLPLFEAYLQLAVIWDSGEMTPGESYFTTGPRYELNPGVEELHFDDTLGGLQTMEDAGLYQFREEGDPFGVGPDPDNFYDHEDFEAAHDAFLQDYNPDDDKYPGKGLRGFRLLTHELLFSKENARKERDSSLTSSYGCKELTVSDPTDIEFLGNGRPYCGRWYRKAVIVFWPRSHRLDVRDTTEGGKEALKAELLLDAGNLDVSRPEKRAKYAAD